MEYSDRDSKNMNNGGHGKLSYTPATTITSIDIPAVLGHTFATPKPFKMIAEHRASNRDKAGAYIPPCSGGKGHSYYATIKAMKGNTELAKEIVELGKY